MDVPSMTTPAVQNGQLTRQFLQKSKNCFVNSVFWTAMPMRGGLIPSVVPAEFALSYDRLTRLVFLVRRYFYRIPLDELTVYRYNQMESGGDEYASFCYSI